MEQEIQNKTKTLTERADAVIDAIQEIRNPITYEFRKEMTEGDLGEYVEKGYRIGRKIDYLQDWNNPAYKQVQENGPENVDDQIEEAVAEGEEYLRIYTKLIELECKYLETLQSADRDLRQKLFGKKVDHLTEIEEYENFKFSDDPDFVSDLDEFDEVRERVESELYHIGSQYIRF